LAVCEFELTFLSEELLHLKFLEFKRAKLVLVVLRLLLLIDKHTCLQFHLLAWLIFPFIPASASTFIAYASHALDACSCVPPGASAELAAGVYVRPS